MTSLEDTLARQLREAANQEPDTAAIERRMAAGFRRRERHRTQQRVALVCAAVVVLVVSSVTVLRAANEDPEGIAVLGGLATPSTFDWSVVNPRNGLAYGSATARTADGAVYSLSTAPGPDQPDTNDFATTLYRSADGSEWSEATQPPGSQTSGVAAAGDTVYSVGTSPAGGLIVSRSTDGATSWTQAHLPDDAGALQREFGNRVALWRPNVVAADDTHLIATITVSANLSLQTYRPEYAHADVDAVWDDAGVTVYDRLDPCDSDTKGLSQQELDALTTCLNDLSEEDVRGEQIAAYSYEELGISSELQELIGGRVFAYASDDGETFDPVDLPIEAPRDPRRTVTAIPLATPDGYRMFVGDSSPGAMAVVLSSRNGYDWTQTGPLPGGPLSAGLLGDRAAVALWSTASPVGASAVLVENTDGTWSTVDLASALSAPGDGSIRIEQLGFGPLGLAAIIAVLPAGGQGGPSAQYIVHSDDGSTLEVISVEQVLGGPGHVQGVSVSADAVMVRVVRDRSDGGSGEPVPAVLVGTPR